MTREEEIMKQIEEDSIKDQKKRDAENITRAQATSTMKPVNFMVNEDIKKDFEARVKADGLTPPVVLRAAVLSYLFGELILKRDRLVSATEEKSNTFVSSIAKNPVGAPRKNKVIIKEEKEEYLEKDPFKAVKNNLPPEKRALASYNHVLIPIERDDRPQLKMTSTDGHGRVFRDYIEEHWLAFRQESIVRNVTERDDWFNITMDIFMACISNKFIEDNNLNFRYHPNDSAADVIEVNQELEEKYAKELDELYDYEVS